MSQLAGTWVYGDDGSTLEYTVTQNGTVMDLTGAGTVVLHMVRMSGGSDVSVTKTGTVQSPATAGVLEFSGIGTAVASPASRLVADVYECRISFVIATETYWTEPFSIQVVKFP